MEYLTYLSYLKPVLHSPTLPHDGYYEFTVSKCLPTFEHFGYKL